MAFNLYSLDVQQKLVQELMALLQEVQEFDFSKFWETGTGDVKCQLRDKLFPNIRQNLDRIEAIINHLLANAKPTPQHSASRSYL